MAVGGEGLTVGMAGRKARRVEGNCGVEVT
jgi:hypothetical protein